MLELFKSDYNMCWARWPFFLNRHSKPNKNYLTCIVSDLFRGGLTGPTPFVMPSKNMSTQNTSAITTIYDMKYDAFLSAFELVGELRFDRLCSLSSRDIFDCIVYEEFTDSKHHWVNWCKLKTSDRILLIYLKNSHEAILQGEFDMWWHCNELFLNVYNCIPC